MKALSVMMLLGIGLVLVSGTPARAQFGSMGDAVKKDASDAARQAVMKGVTGDTGVPATGEPPAAGAGVAAQPVGEPKVAPAVADAPPAAPGSDIPAANAPAGEPKVAPAAAEVPAAADAPAVAGDAPAAADAPAVAGDAPAAAKAPAGDAPAADETAPDADAYIKKMIPNKLP